MEEVFPFLIGFTLLGVLPITSVITQHMRKMEEIRARARGNASSEILQELAALRREMAELRDTTTRFDMSFDAAITRLEARMDATERSLSSTSSTASSSYKPIPVEEELSVQVRR